MFEEFNSKYVINNTPSNYTPVDLPMNVKGLNKFFDSYSGCSFSDGLYRVHSYQNIDKWNEIVGRAFPEFANRVYCFGVDWLGRQFALDSGRMDSDEPLVLLLEPGTGEALEIPVNFVQFHNEELVRYRNEALAVEFFYQWLSLSDKPPTIEQCVGYIKPLFLNGEDTTKNLEIVDLEVYWELSIQLLDKVRGLPPGATIDNVEIS